MDLFNLHKRGERITIRWPGGPHDFVLEFEYAEPVGGVGWEDWFTITGVVVEPGTARMQSFYVHPVEAGVYALLPVRESSPVRAKLRPDRDKLS